MSARGGQREGAGRPKGAPNKLSGNVKAMILGALDQAGGQDYLARQAELNPSAFLVLIGKVLPLQVTGEDGGPIEMIVTGVRRAMEIEEDAEPLAITVTGVQRDEDED